MGGGIAGAEDGNGTVPGAGAGPAVLDGLARSALGGADGFCSVCEPREGPRGSKEGRSLSRDGRDLSRDGRKVDTLDEVVRSNEGRWWILGGGIAFEDARMVNEDGGGVNGWCVGGRLSLRAGERAAGRAGAGESANWTGKAARAGVIAVGRLALEGVLTRCKAGGRASRTGVETRSGGGVGAPGRSRSNDTREVLGKETLVVFGVAIMDLSGGRRWNGSRLGARTRSPALEGFSEEEEL